MAIKTLHLTNAYHPTSGGIRTFYRAMLAAANREQRPMRLVVPGEETRVEEVGAYGRIYHVRAPRSPWVDSRYRLILPQAFLLPRGEVRRILEAEQPDLVEVCDKYSLCHLAGMLRRGWMRGIARPTLVGLSCERLDDNLLAPGVLGRGMRGEPGAAARGEDNLLAPGVLGRGMRGEPGAAARGEDNLLAPGVLGRRTKGEPGAPIHGESNVAGSLTIAGLGRRFARWYIGQIYAGQFDFHLANSEYTARELRDHLLVKHWREIHVVPMGVGVEDLGPEHRSAALRDELLARLGGDARTVLLLYAGRLSQEKNLSLLIDALERLGEGTGADFRLVVAGDGPMAASLRGEAERRVPGRVLFWGHVADRETLARLYATSDIFVHPNPREPFGIGPLEAMASGVPLVAPEAGGVLSYANARNAWLAAPTAEDFAAAVRAAAVAGEDRDARVALARETAAGYRWSSVTRIIFGLYDALHARRAALVDEASRSPHASPARDPRSVIRDTGSAQP